MRIWHYRLLPYLPEAQFKGQLRELVVIMRDWKNKGKTNHILINKVMEYDKAHLKTYFEEYRYWYSKRLGKQINKNIVREFNEFCEIELYPNAQGYPRLFSDWHNEEYLKICMANLYEKFRYSVGSSALTYEEWKTLARGYEEITGKIYRI